MCAHNAQYKDKIKILVVMCMHENYTEFSSEIKNSQFP